jgi:hypothetical protein
MGRDAAKKDVPYCYEDQDAEGSARLIPEHQILRLVILNLAQQLIGVISLDDLDRGEETLTVKCGTRVEKSVIRGQFPDAHSNSTTDKRGLLGRLKHGGIVMGRKKRSEGGHPQGIDPGAPSEPPGGRLKDIESDVEDLGARVENLEQQPTSPDVPKSSKATIGAVGGPVINLQELLPQIKELAEKVGGLQNLSEIIETLKQTKK